MFVLQCQFMSHSTLATKSSWLKAVLEQSKTETLVMKKTSFVVENFKGPVYFLSQLLFIHCTKKRNFPLIKDLFSKCDQIRSFLWIWSHLLKKSLMENFIFCAVIIFNNNPTPLCLNWGKMWIKRVYWQLYLNWKMEGRSVLNEQWRIIRFYHEVGGF